MAALLLSLWGPVSVQAQETRSHTLSIQYHRAEAAYRTGANLMEAKIRLDNVLEELPDDVAARKLRARVLLELGRAEDALNDASHAAELVPEDGEARLIHAEAARLAGEHELAVDELQAAADHVFDDPRLHLRLSWNAYLLDEMDQAEAYARTSLALQATDAAFYQLARIFLRQDQRDQAATVLERGIKMRMVQPVVIQRDSVLQQVSDHPRLRAFMP